MTTSDTARDLAKFLGDLTKTGGQANSKVDVRSLRLLFLESYSNDLPEEIWERTLAYEALSYFKYASKRPGLEEACHWLRMAERCLGSADQGDPCSANEPRSWAVREDPRRTGLGVARMMEVEGKAAEAVSRFSAVHSRPEFLGARLS